jgi:hypothetical protein
MKQSAKFQFDHSFISYYMVYAYKFMIIGQYI